MALAAAKDNSSKLTSFMWSSWAFSFSNASTSPTPPSSWAVKTDLTDAPKVVATIRGKLETVWIAEISTVGRLPVSRIGALRFAPRSERILQPAVLPHTVRGIALKNLVWLFRACQTFRPYVVLKIPVAVSTVNGTPIPALAFFMKPAPKTL